MRRGCAVGRRVRVAAGTGGCTGAGPCQDVTPCWAVTGGAAVSARWWILGQRPAAAGLHLVLAGVLHVCGGGLWTGAGRRRRGAGRWRRCPSTRPDSWVFGCRRAGRGLAGGRRPGAPPPLRSPPSWRPALCTDTYPAERGGPAVGAQLPQQACDGRSARGAPRPRMFSRLAWRRPRSLAVLGAAQLTTRHWRAHLAMLAAAPTRARAQRPPTAARRKQSRTSPPRFHKMSGGA